MRGGEQCHWRLSWFSCRRHRYCIVWIYPRLILASYLSEYLQAVASARRGATRTWLRIWPLFPLKHGFPSLHAQTQLLCCNNITSPSPASVTSRLINIVGEGGIGSIFFLPLADSHEIDGKYLQTRRRLHPFVPLFSCHRNESGPHPRYFCLMPFHILLRIWFPTWITFCRLRMCM